MIIQTYPTRHSKHNLEINRKAPILTTLFIPQIKGTFCLTRKKQMVLLTQKKIQQPRPLMLIGKPPRPFFSFSLLFLLFVFRFVLVFSLACFLLFGFIVGLV
jgi:hypothetical protein